MADQSDLDPPTSLPGINNDEQPRDPGTLSRYQGLQVEHESYAGESGTGENQLKPDRGAIAETPTNPHAILNDQAISDRAPSLSDAHTVDVVQTAPVLLANNASSAPGGPTLSQLADVCDDADTAIQHYDLHLRGSSSFTSLVKFLMDLGDFWLSRFEESEDPLHIDKCLHFIGKAKEEAKSGHEPGLVDHLIAICDIEGQAFYSRFKSFGEISDIENSIAAWEDALDYVDNVDGKNDEKARVLSCLGDVLEARFGLSDDMADLDDAILKYKEAVGLTPDSHAKKPSRFNNLAYSLQSRFELTGELADLDDAILAQQQAVDLTPVDDVHKASRSSNLGVSLQSRFERSNDMADLSKAILLHKQAVDLTPDGHADKPSWLNNFATALQNRYEYLDDLADLDEAILTKQRAINLIPDGHPNKPFMLNNLGNSLQSRFERLGELVDIDHAILTQQQAVDLVPDGHANKPFMFNNLGTALQLRFGWLGNPADLDKAVLMKQQAVDLTPDGHPDKATYLNNFGNSLQVRFGRSGDLTDLNNAILVKQKAVNLMPDEHAIKPSLLNGLGLSLQSRFERLDDLADLNNAVLAKQHAVDLTPDGHPNRSTFLNNLGISLQSRFERLDDPADLDNAILRKQEAVDLTPDGHAEKPARLNGLGLSLQARYQRSKEPGDRARIISSFHQAAIHPSGRPFYRFQAARNWADFLHPDLEPYHTVISLIPQIAWLGSTIEKRFEELQAIGEAVANGVSAACASAEYDLALEWLEQGRTIVWSQILRLRSPVDVLQASSPDLAKEFSRIAGQLDMASTGNERASDGSSQSLEQIAQRHHRLVEEWEKLLKKIQDLPDFADFLQPKAISMLKKAPISGTAVVINASDYRSDALILRSGSSSIEHIYLPSLSLRKSKTIRDKLTMSLHALGVRFRDAERGSSPAGSRTALENALKILWADVAKPILDHLGYTSTLPIGDLPHIIWCLTGPLATLPLHAAGIYDDPNGQDKLFNYATSSYTPSLTALLKVLERERISERRILAITQEDTPNLSSLPGTMSEVNQVQDQMRKYEIAMTRMDGGKATVKAVSEAMNTHSWVHLSCHGKQDPMEPLKSAFYLHDGTLKLGEIMKNPLKHAELAYLSACQTATGDAVKLPDEVVHLAAGMFTAGYRSVVATLWSIRDNDAPLVAEVFYDRLLSNPEGGVARALHDAVTALRQEVGEKKFLSWVPFIHLGH